MCGVDEWFGLQVGVTRKDMAHERGYKVEDHKESGFHNP
jgi:hypothetical protein